MKPKLDTVRIIEIFGAFLGLASTLIANYSTEQKMMTMIEEAVKEEISKRM